MKNFFLHTLILTIAIVSETIAQSFPKTYTSFPCVNCTPAGYSLVSGGPVALSNSVGLGGSPTKPWVNGFSNPPSGSKAVDGNYNNIFLTLRYGTIQKDKLKANVSGFEVGNKYTMHYYVSTSRVQLSTGNTSYAASATIEVQTLNSTSVAIKNTSFVPGSNVDQWVEQTLTFVAPATELVFYLSALSNPQETAFVNFDIYSKPFDCVVPGGQVELYHGGTQSTPFACATTNLFDLIKSTTPAGTTPVWGINPSSSYPQMTEEEAKSAGPKPAGQYYYAFYKTPGGCYNTELSTAKVSFTATPTQVSLTSNEKSIDCINQTSVNLNTQVAPTNYKVQWFTNDKHQGLPFDMPQSAKAGEYYAFYFDSKNNCYSVDKASVGALFSVVGATMCCNDPNDPSNQVPLLNTDVKIVAPATTYDLTKLIPSNLTFPPAVVIEWYTSADHDGSPIADPQHVGAGKFYAFAHDLSNGCFNVPLSKSIVNVAKTCNAGITPPSLKDNSSILYCQEGEPPINLNDYLVSAPPAGLTVRWFDNTDHTGNDLTIVTTADNGEYYAFFYDDVNQCYSPRSKGLTFHSRQVYLNCGENGCELNTGCPLVGVNLNSTHIGAVPQGWELRWFNNTTHSGQFLQNPTSVTTPGEYYGFYYSPTKQCYNKTGLQNGGNDQANKKVVVTNQPCAGPQLNVKVALQGAYETDGEGSIMHTHLQEYDTGTGIGLLPNTSPYGGNALYPEINDPTGKAERVVDWVKVEIHDAANPATVLDSRDLLLKPDGAIWDIDGTSPIFNAQSVPVRIAIKHRNHLAIMSNPIQNFNVGATISYDFTTALSQASNEFGDPPQMVQKNGVWCMQAGDLNANPDLVVDGADGAYFKAQFKTGVFDVYDRADVNMDGIVDGLDGSYFKSNFLKGIYSSIINY